MTSPGGSGRRRAAVRYEAEDQALNTIAKEAEARLAMRRAARAEAREIRMRELEKQQQESEKQQDRHYEIMRESTAPASSEFLTTTSRLYNKNEEEPSESTKELKKEVSELEEKYKKAMMSTAQLDNEKQTYRYQVELLKDQLEDLEEQCIELQRINRDTTKELEAQKRDFKDLQNECSFLKEQVTQRDKLIEEYGLVFISNDTMVGEDGQKGRTSAGGTTALVTPEAASVLKKAEGNLDERLKTFSQEKERLEEEIRKLRQQLEEEREKNVLSERFPSPKQADKVNGPDPQIIEAQMEATRQVQEYKIKLKKAEQDITTLEGNVLRLESQAKRYKTASENSEKQEEELKLEKRKLQRELREAQNQIEEITTQNHHLTKRLEKMKSARNAILKP